MHFYLRILESVLMSFGYHERIVVDLDFELGLF